MRKVSETNLGIGVVSFSFCTKKNCIDILSVRVIMTFLSFAPGSKQKQRHVLWVAGRGQKRDVCSSQLFFTSTIITLLGLFSLATLATPKSEPKCTILKITISSMSHLLSSKVRGLLIMVSFSSFLQNCLLILFLSPVVACV